MSGQAGALKEQHARLRESAWQSHAREGEDADSANPARGAHSKVCGVPGGASGLARQIYGRRQRQVSNRESCTTSLSGSEDASAMEGGTGTMAGLGHMWWWRRETLYGLANNDFRIVSLAEMEVAYTNLIPLPLR